MMSHWKVFLLLFIPGGLLAQLSYEFKSALPPAGDVLKTVGSSHFGTYVNAQTGTVFQFNEEGVAMIAIINSYITKEQVRETSRFQVRNNYLFGVVEGDSVPCIFENDKYYFGMKQKTMLNDATHKGVLKKINDYTYIINFYEGSSYTPSMITFKNNAIFLNHFDYATDTHIFDAVKEKEILNGSNYTTHLLNPSQKEWEALVKQPMFGKETVFTKQAL